MQGHHHKCAKCGQWLAWKGAGRTTHGLNYQSIEPCPHCLENERIKADVGRFFDKIVEVLEDEKQRESWIESIRHARWLFTGEGKPANVEALYPATSER